MTDQKFHSSSGGMAHPAAHRKRALILALAIVALVLAIHAAAPENTARAPPLDPGATVRSPRIRGILQKMAPRRRIND